jgi:hypothetical protein
VVVNDDEDEDLEMVEKNGQMGEQEICLTFCVIAH